MGDTLTPIMCTTDIRQVCRPLWISIRAYPSPTINLISEDSHRGTHNRLHTTRLITQTLNTRTHNSHITLVLFIQPIQTEQATTPCRATIVSRALVDTTGRPRQSSPHRSVKSGGSFTLKADMSEYRMAFALPRTGVPPLQMSQVMLTSQVPPCTRLGMIPDCTNLPTKLFNPSMFPS